MRTTLLILSISASAGFVPKIPSPAKSPLRAEATESEAPAEAEAEAPAEPAAPAPAPASSFDPDKVFKVDESPLMAYISRSWNKLDGSDTVEVEEMLKDPATVATINQPDELGANLCGNQPECRVPDNSSLSHFSAMTRPCWLGRAARNRHRHAIEQASRRWRGGLRDDSAERAENFDFHTAATSPRA